MAAETASLRRKLLVGGVAAAAAAAGGGVAWWRLRPSPAADAAASQLLAQTFESPGGAPVRMADFRGRHLLVNFWATWCPPCVEEMPLLDRFFREQAASGWQVVGLAIDQPSAVRQFLARTMVTFPIGFAGLDGSELGKSLGNQAGGLPFTVVLGPDGQVRQRKMGQVTPAELAQWKAAAHA